MSKISINREIKRLKFIMYNFVLSAEEKEYIRKMIICLESNK